MQSGMALSELPPKILLVDDSEQMLDSAAAVLSGQFEIVGAVRDGRSALEAAGTLEPDIIVLDISMPGMGGLEVAARLRACGSKAKLVFLTVHDDEELVQAAQRAGGIGYVLKPRLASELPTAASEASAGRPFFSADLRRPA